MHFSKMQNKCNTVYRFEKERLTSERDQIAIMNDNFRKIRAALTSRHQIPLQWLNRYLSAFTNIKKFQTTWNLSFKNGYFFVFTNTKNFCKLKSFFNRYLSVFTNTKKCLQQGNNTYCVLYWKESKSWASL